MQELGSFETLMQKHQLFHDWASTQDAQYSLDIRRKGICSISIPINMLNDILEEEIELAKRDIEQLQLNLEAARKRKSEKIVYDVIASGINKLPARDKSIQ